MTFGPEDFAEKLNVSRETMDDLVLFSEILIKWQKRINLETAWLLSPYLIERRKKSRWSTLYV